MVEDLLLPAQFAALMSVRERRGRQLLAELEALGFVLTPDNRGARQVPRQVAEAAKAAHQAGRDLASLRLNVALTPYLARDVRGVEPDSLDVLIYTAVEVSIVREAVAVLAEALTTGASRSSYRALSFRNASLPDPRQGL